MRNLLALIGLVVVGFAVVGWYCGWYTFSVQKGTGGKPEIKTTVDTDKVTSDSESFFKRMGELVKEKAKSNSEKSPPAESPVNTPAPSKDGSTQRIWNILPSRPVSTSTAPDRQ